VGYRARSRSLKYRCCADRTWPVAGFKKWSCRHAGQVAAMPITALSIRFGWRAVGSRTCTRWFVLGHK
jgi:hypothetical protein